MGLSDEARLEMLELSVLGIIQHIDGTKEIEAKHKNKYPPGAWSDEHWAGFRRDLIVAYHEKHSRGGPFCTLGDSDPDHRGIRYSVLTVAIHEGYSKLSGEFEDEHLDWDKFYGYWRDYGSKLTKHLECPYTAWSYHMIELVEEAFRSLRRYDDGWCADRANISAVLSCILMEARRCVDNRDLAQAHMQHQIYQHIFDKNMGGPVADWFCGENLHHGFGHFWREGRDPKLLVERYKDLQRKYLLVDKQMPDSEAVEIVLFLLGGSWVAERAGQKFKQYGIRSNNSIHRQLAANKKLREQRAKNAATGTGWVYDPVTRQSVDKG